MWLSPCIFMFQWPWFLQAGSLCGKSEHKLIPFAWLEIIKLCQSQPTTVLRAISSVLHVVLEENFTRCAYWSLHPCSLKLNSSSCISTLGNSIEVSNGIHFNPVLVNPFVVATSACMPHLSMGLLVNVVLRTSSSRFWSAIISVHAIKHVLHPADSRLATVLATHLNSHRQVDAFALATWKPGRA